MFMVAGTSPPPPPLNDSSECNMNKLCIIGTSHSKITLKFFNCTLSVVSIEWNPQANTRFYYKSYIIYNYI